MTRATRIGISRTFLGALFAASACALALAQSAAMTRGTGTVQLTIDGGPFKGAVITLAQKSGDWFATPADAHATLTLGGPHKGSVATLHLQWDGLEADHVVNAENNTDVGGAHVTFLLTLDGPAPFDLAAKPQGDDAATITVDKISEVDLQATISGTVTSSVYDESEHRSPQLTIEGTIDLHRPKAPVRPTSATYTSCDNVIRDKLVGAEARSPSECEVKFDLDVRQALGRAFEKVASHFADGPWQIERQSEVKPITGIARGSEKNFFRMEFSNCDHYVLNARMDPGSQEYQAYRARFEELQPKLQEELRSSNGKPGPAYDAMRKLGEEVEDATKVGIIVNINETSGGFVNFTGEHRVLQVPGAAYAIATTRAQAPTGGGADNAIGDETFIFFGNWKPGFFEKHSDGGERFNIASTMSPAASHLSVQNITLLVRCNPALTDTVLKLIELAALQALITP